MKVSAKRTCLRDTLKRIILLAMFLSAGCSNHNYFGESEEALDTSGYYQVLDHISNYYPSAIALNFPGYIVGFEEASSDLVTKGREDVLLDESKLVAGYTVKRLLRQLNYDVPPR